MDIFDGASENVDRGHHPRRAQRHLRQRRNAGIFVNGANGNRIQGNYIGTDKSGTKDLGNGEA